MISRETALAIVREHTNNPNLIKHALAVESAMEALAHELGGEVTIWKLVGLLHDADWEETRNDPSKHTLKTVMWLNELGENTTEIIEAILSHNWEYTGYRQPEGELEWSLFCCDELTGFIVATALVSPQKKLNAIETDSIIKKFPQKAFAASIKREQIALCEKKLGIPLPNFIDIVFKGMQKNRKELKL